MTVVFLIAGLLGISVSSAAIGQASSLTPAASDGPAAVAGRVELLEGRYAVTFPESWTVNVYRDALVSGWGPIPMPAASEPDTDVMCEVKAYGPCAGEPYGSCSALLDGWAADRVAWFENGPAVVEEVALSVSVDAVRVDVEWADVPRFITAYMLTDGTIAASLLCHGSERPGDRWLSIAETFELLPGES